MDNSQKNNDHPRPTDISDEQIPSDELDSPVGSTVVPDSSNENVYPAEQKDNIVNSGQDKSGILDIFYGVLFEPARTFAGFAPKPPIVLITIIFVALNLAEALTGIFTTPVYLDKIGQLPGITGAGAKQAMLSFVAIAGFLFSLIKWFFMAGLLHLLAELYGGNGTARSVWAVYGVAGLPAVFMIPVRIISNLVTNGGPFDYIAGMLTLGLYAWGVILLIIGLREVHHFSTGRAAFTVITPWLMLVFLTLVTLIFIGTTVSTIIMQGF